MAIGKPRGKNGQRPVYVYNAAVKRKVYVGSRGTLKDARQLERDKADEFNRRGQPAPKQGPTCGEYADTWLTVHHGPGTRRPASATVKVNRGYLRAFRADFGARPLDGGIARLDALEWSKSHPHSARVVSAMLTTPWTPASLRQTRSATAVSPQAAAGRTSHR
jgi:hypothetical protein